jgi:hypothetical protein
MRGDEMYEQKGVPRISRITWFWALVFTFFTSGIFALGLALYLSFWVHARRKAGVALYGYLTLAVALTLGLLPVWFFPHGVAWEAYSTAASVAVLTLWIGSGFVLRREFQLYYARPDGSLPPISQLWTAIFSVYYLNYWLWVLRDTV